MTESSAGTNVGISVLLLTLHASSITGSSVGLNVYSLPISLLEVGKGVYVGEIPIVFTGGDTNGTCL